MDHSAHSHRLTFGDASFDVADRRVDFAPLDGGFLALLRGFVSDTWSSCRFYRQRLDRAAIQPQAIDSFDAFRRIPTLGPDDVAAVSELRLLPDRYQQALVGDGSLASLPVEQRAAKKFMTSSSAGPPKVSYYTQADWQAALATFVRGIWDIPIHKFSRAFNCFHAGHMGGKFTEDAWSRYGCIVENRHPSHVTDEQVLKQLYAGLPELGGFNALSIPPWQPTGSAAQKGATLDSLLDADTDNYIGRKIQVVSMAGAPTDMPDLHLKQRVWEANQQAGAERAIVIAKYGCSEVGTFASECPADDGMHLFHGQVYVEVIDDRTGMHARNGERGLVVVTGLRHGSRYLRYVCGDEALFFDEPCRCGRTSPRLKEVRRVRDRERLKAGCAAGGY